MRTKPKVSGGRTNLSAGAGLVDELDRSLHREDWVWLEVGLGEA